MPEEYRKVFINVFSRLKVRVLWKWETESMEGLPPNVKLMKWVPQQDVLGKNILLFGKIEMHFDNNPCNRRCE
jgi:hypothetical protein